MKSPPSSPPTAHGHIRASAERLVSPASIVPSSRWETVIMYGPEFAMFLGRFVRSSTVVQSP